MKRKNPVSDRKFASDEGNEEDDDEGSDNDDGEDDEN